MNMCIEVACQMGSTFWEYHHGQSGESRHYNLAEVRWTIYIYNRDGIDYLDTFMLKKGWQ